MLTEKRKKFIESIALRVQDYVGYQEPNIYNYNHVIDFLKEMGANFKHGTENYTKGSNIYLTFFSENNSSDVKKGFKNDDNGNIIFNTDESIILFHELWHFLYNRLFASLEQAKYMQDHENYLTDNSSFAVSNEEDDAIYFSFAMFIPEKTFRKYVSVNSDIDGFCDIYTLADTFRIPYYSIYKRGNELRLWNTN